jgi:hypothetical protein
MHDMISAEPPRVSSPALDPCYPSPCGENAVCTNRNRAAACQCIPEHLGDPYIACRPECSVNADCPPDRACQRAKCTDPCPGLCGSNAVCKVLNHVPTCMCLGGYVGDPFTSCRLSPLCKFLVLHFFHRVCRVSTEILFDICCIFYNLGTVIRFLMS